MTDRREPFSIRLGKNRLVRSFFLGLAKQPLLHFLAAGDVVERRVRDDDDALEGDDEGSIA